MVLVILETMMKQDKTTFIVDNYVDIKSHEDLLAATILLASEAGVMFVVEPWPGNRWRIYVKKGSELSLKAVEELLKKK